MKVIVGLGNPGPQYAQTRHNVGVDFVDKLVGSSLMIHSDYGWRKFYGIYVYKIPQVILAKTANYFMNESGNVVNDVFRLDELSTNNYELFVAHDDLDLRLGEYKIQKGVGPRLHYGVRSIEEAVGAKDFWRIRIGVDNRIAGRQDIEPRVRGEEYVLQKFAPEEKEIIDDLLAKIASEIAQADS